MKSLFFAALIGFSALTGCDDSGTGGTTGAMPDLSMKAQPDLSMALKGCNGYLACLQNAMSTADEDACTANATSMASDLFGAFNDCLTTTCLNTVDADFGAPDCTGPSDTGPRCSACIQNSIKTGGACKASLDACRADKP
jgi:hypothetical protein